MRAGAAALLAAAGVLAGCVVAVDYGGTSYRCGSGDCPAGQACVAGVCVAAAAPPDALPPNLLANGDMEGGLDCWSAYRGVLRETTNMPHGGARAIVACKTAGMDTSLFTAFADVKVGAGTIARGEHITASVWVRASFAPAEPAPPQLEVVLHEAGGAAAPVDHHGTAVRPITTDWTVLTVAAVVEQADRDRIELLIWPGDVVDDTCFGFDDAHAGAQP